MKQVIIDSELGGALFEIDINFNNTAQTHFGFIDLDPQKSLWVEIQFSAEKILEMPEEELLHYDFKYIFQIKESVKVGFFQTDIDSEIEA